MVSLKDFILVEDQKNFDVKKFYADCKPFLEEIRGIREEDLPKTGSLGPYKSTWSIERVPPQKAPSYYGPHINKLFNDIDNYFKERFNWRALTHSVSTTGDFYRAHYDGAVSLCFPIGNRFQTLWSDEMEDFNEWFRFSTDENGTVVKTIEEIKNMHWNYNRDLKRGYKSKNEVLINADKVYVISMNSPEYNEVIDYLASLRVITYAKRNYPPKELDYSW